MIIYIMPVYMYNHVRGYNYETRVRAPVPKLPLRLPYVYLTVMVPAVQPALRAGRASLSPVACLHPPAGRHSTGIDAPLSPRP